jgi:hypothetical protein
MSGGPKRNPDSLNTFGVVVVGICGAVMVYVAITALQAFYMNDTSELQTMQDYGGQDTTAKSHKAAEMENIEITASNPAAAGQQQTYHVKVEHAMKLIADEASKPGWDPTHLVPALQPATKPTVQPKFGRPIPLAPAAAAGSGAGSAAPVQESPSPPAAGTITPPPPAQPNAPAMTGSGGHAP